MNFITNIINSAMKRLIKNDKKVLGRWNIDYCDKKMKHKIDLANEDHCGPSGQYAMDKTLLNNKTSVK